MACSICKELCITNFFQVGSKGRATLVAASLERKDGLHEDLQKATPLTLHTTCRKVYTRESSIKAEKRKSEELAADDEDRQPELRSRTPVFDITTHCLFCSELLPTGRRLTVKRQKLISNVETLEFKDSVIKRARDRTDMWGEAVSKRVEATIDLVAARAKYHRTCAQEFFSKSEKVLGNGKPADSVREAAFNDLCAYLDENDECQYAVSELMEYMETFLNGEEGYSLKYFKQKMIEKYGNNFIITSVPGKSSIVSFRDSAYRILHEKFVKDHAAEKILENERIMEMAASIIRDEIRMSVYDLSEYPSLDETENGWDMIPESLKVF